MSDTHGHLGGSDEEAGRPHDGEKLDRGEKDPSGGENDNDVETDDDLPSGG